ncbi:hypothetical protein M9H77_17433 [Catharanthus roseus]|uniref:Uncharacterized protein n=1 Tax=Catharanthus roseus TaxID=4058 RepID=A0ACC0B4J6_CATRO|nr:hypothetical protein M9H77_17433 [Catharanthus roseus]
MGIDPSKHLFAEFLVGYHDAGLGRDVRLVLWRKCCLSCYYPSDLAYLYIFLELLLIVQVEAMMPSRTAPKKEKTIESEMGVCVTYCHTGQGCEQPPGTRHGRCATSWRTHRVVHDPLRMTQSSLESKIKRLGPIVDKRGGTHGCMMTTSFRGFRGRPNTSDVPATPPYGMFHGPDTFGSSIPPPSIPTRVQMPHDPHTPVPFQYSAVPLHVSHPSVSSSLAHHPDASYVHDIHQYRIPMSLGVQYPSLDFYDFLVGVTGDSLLYQQGYYDTSEQMSSYALRSRDVQGGQGDDTTVQAGENDQGLDVGEGWDDQGKEEEEEGDQEEEEGSKDRGGVHISSLGHSGRVRELIERAKRLVKICKSGMIDDSQYSGERADPLKMFKMRLQGHRGHQELVFLFFCNGINYVTIMIQECYILRLQGHHAALTSYTPSDPDTWIYLYFSMFVGPISPCSVPKIPSIQHFVMMGQKNGTVALSDYRMRALWYDAVGHCVHADHMRIVMPPYGCHPSYMPWYT